MATEEEARAVQELDLRRQGQIQRQVESINRLLGEIAELKASLAWRESQIDRALRVIRNANAEGCGHVSQAERVLGESDPNVI